MPPRKAAKKKKATVRRVSRLRPSARVTKSRNKKLAVPQPMPAAVVSFPKIRVRVYRQGLGDCFLLTFNPGGDEKHILIDCGTLGATTTGIKLPDVAADIDKTTNGHLHLVVATISIKTICPAFRRSLISSVRARTSRSIMCGCRGRKIRTINWRSSSAKPAMIWQSP